MDSFLHWEIQRVKREILQEDFEKKVLALRRSGKAFTFFEIHWYHWERLQRMPFTKHKDIFVVYDMDSKKNLQYVLDWEYNKDNQITYLAKVFIN